MTNPLPEKLLLIPLTARSGEIPRSERETKSREAQLRSRIHYVGFRTTEAGREYTLHVVDKERSRDFVMLITHGAFESGQARFQDGPDICCGKLMRVLAEDPADEAPSGPVEPLVFTKEELLEYRARSAPAPTRSRKKPRDPDLESAG
jgi:hypothetical protein